MTFNDFDELKPLGEGLVSRPNKAFRDYAETGDFEHLGAPLGIWLEKGVVDFLETLHGLPHHVTDEELAAASAASVKKIGPLQYRIIRVGKRAEIKGHLLGSMHRLRQFRNATMHGTPELAEKAKLDALAIRNWLVQDYVPLYSRTSTAKPAAPSSTKNYPTETWPQESDYDPYSYVSPSPAPQPARPPNRAPPPRAATPRRSDPSVITQDPYRPEVSDRISSSEPFLTPDMVGFLAVAAVILSLGLTVIWYSYKAVIAVAEWWTGLPTLTQVMKNIPVPTNPWANDSKPTSPMTKVPPPFTDKVQLPPPEVTRPPPQPVSPPVTPSPPPIVQLECPPGTLYDSYTSQCTFLPPNDQAASAGPPLSIHPECPSGSTYSDQSETCAIIEANNECPPGAYQPEGSHKCLSKQKYPFFRYEETHTLLATLFVQAPPVDESYAVHVLAGSLRIFYLDDPTSASHVILRGRAQYLYNYAIISCVICPATFVTRRVN
jgi:hypothetical protein